MDQLIFSCSRVSLLHESVSETHSINIISINNLVQLHFFTNKLPMFYRENHDQNRRYENKNTTQITRKN